MIRNRLVASPIISICADVIARFGMDKSEVRPPDHPDRHGSLRLGAGQDDWYGGTGHLSLTPGDSFEDGSGTSFSVANAMCLQNDHWSAGLFLLDAAQPLDDGSEQCD